MIALVGVVDEHTEAVEYDLIRCGLRLRDWPHGGVSWRDLFVLVRQAQPDSAMFKAMNPRWQHTPEAELLRSIEFSLRAANWQRAQGKGERPEPYLFPWEDDGRQRPDALSWDEAADFLGWGDEMREWFDKHN